MIQLRNSKTGETVIVEKADGYRTADGWREVANDVPRPKASNAEYRGGKWQEDKEATRLRDIRGLSQEQLFDYFDKITKALEARIVALETKS